MMARYAGPPPDPMDQPLRTELSHFELAEIVLNDIDLDDISGSDRVRNIALTALAHAVLALAVTQFPLERVEVEQVLAAFGDPPHPHSRIQTAEPKYDPTASVENLPRAHPPHVDD